MSKVVPPPFRCIAFDAVGTVMFPEPAASQVYYRLAQQFGSRLSPEETALRFRQAFRESEQGDHQATPDSRYTTSEEIEYRRWQSIVARVLDDVADPVGCFEQLFEHFARPDSWRCFDEVTAVVTALRSRGYQTVLASNFDRRLHAVCDGIPALQLFSQRIISSEVGCRKPGKPFYEALIECSGCQPHEILMVGDDLENDVVGARAAGLSAVYVNRRTPCSQGEISDLRGVLALLES
jgi:putative hydrolase of the HAD superfamily